MNLLCGKIRKQEINDAIRDLIMFVPTENDIEKIANYISELEKDSEEIIKTAREHIADIHLGYGKILENICKVKVSPLDILEKIERKPGESYIRRLIFKEKEEDGIIINFKIPEKSLILYKEEK